MSTSTPLHSTPLRTVATSRIALDPDTAHAEHRVDPDDPTAPPCPFTISPMLKKTLPRNVLFADFESSTEAVRAAMVLHPAGLSLAEILATDGTFSVNVRTIGTFDDPAASDGATMRRGTATLLVSRATQIAYGDEASPIFELVDSQIRLDGRVTMTADLARFLQALSVDCAGIQPSWPGYVSDSPTSLRPAHQPELV